MTTTPFLRARRGLVVASAAALALGLLGPIGVAAAAPSAPAPATPGTLSVASGPTAGGTRTAISIPMLDGALRATASAGWQTFLGQDGAVYQANFLQAPRRVSPAGMTFTTISSQESSGRTFVSAIASDGTVWSVKIDPGGAQMMTKVEIPGTVAKISAAGYYLMTDGSVYDNTTRVATPTGHTFTSIDSSTTALSGLGTSVKTIARAVASDGTAWESTNGSAFTQIAVGRPVAQATSSYYFLATDGAVYYGSKRVSPAGVTFASITGRMSNRLVEGPSDFVSAIATDGTAWGSTNGGAMVKAPVPVPVVQANGAFYFLGTDGAVYYGAKRISPAGMTFSSISGGMMDSYRQASSTVSAVASDGTVWASDGSTWKLGVGGNLQSIPSNAAQTVTSVTFGGTPALEVTQNGSTVDAVTPAHGAGSVDVTVITSDGATYTLPAAFTFSKPTVTPVSVPVRITSTGAGLGVGAEGIDCLGNGVGGGQYGYGCLAMRLTNPLPLTAGSSYFDVTLTRGAERPQAFLFDGYWRLTDLGTWQIEGCADEACTTSTIISTPQTFAVNSPLAVNANATGAAYQTYRLRYLGGGAVNTSGLGPEGLPPGTHIGGSGLTEMYLLLP